MYESFGAHVDGQAVEFRLFLPDATVDPTQYTNTTGDPRLTEIRVAGDFQRHLGGHDWDLTTAPVLARGPHPNGAVYTHRIDGLPDGFYQYKYFVTFANSTRRWVGDPCAHYVVGAEENAGFVVGGPRTNVTPIGSSRPLRDLVVYELMLDDFTAGYRDGAAPVDAVRNRIDYLVGLGVNAVEFLPWTAWRGGQFSWGYNPFAFFAVENRYLEQPGGDETSRLYRLKTLVNALHRRGIHVVMDGVFNHVDAGAGTDGKGFPYHWLYQDPEESPFTGGFEQAGYFEDLDFNNRCTEQFIFDACRFWLDEYQLDGVRLDYTLGFYRERNPGQGLTKLVTDLRAHLQATGRDDVAITLEHMSDNRYEAIDVTNKVCADACWYDRLHWDLPAAAVHGVDPALMRALDSDRDFAPPKQPMIYLENHDHSSLTNRVGGRNRWWRVQAPLIALCTTPGGILLHNGQEFGQDEWLPEDGDGRVLPRPLRWELLDDEIGKRLFALHAKLLRIRQAHPALRTPNFYPSGYDERQTHFNDQGYGVDVDKDVVIYHRWGTAAGGRLERFVVALNFSPGDQWADIPFSTNGRWTDLLTGRRFQVDGFRLPNQSIPSNWGYVFHQPEPDREDATPTERLMLDPSMLLGDQGFGWLASEDLNQFVISATFVAQLRGEVAYSDHDRELFGELPIEADRGALLNLVGPIGRFGLQDIDTELLPESVRAVAAQLQAAGSQVAAEEWLYLATNSWLAARSRRIFDAFNQAGAAALELGRDVLGDVVHRTLQLPSDAPPVLRPELIARAGLRWLAVGGPAIAPLLFPPGMAALAAILGGGYLLLSRTPQLEAIT